MKKKRTLKRLRRFAKAMKMSKSVRAVANELGRYKDPVRQEAAKLARQLDVSLFRIAVSEWEGE